MSDILVIGIISAVVSFVASMLGLGGAVMLIPALLFIPPLFGVDPLSIHAVSGLAPLQVLATSLVAVILHHRRGAVDRGLVLLMGIPIVISSFAGAYCSGLIAAGYIIVVFSLMALTGALLIFLKPEYAERAGSSLVPSRAMAVSLSLGIGFFGGLAGAPGAFILSPLMMTVLRIPTRIVVGSTLGIVLMASLSTLIGKFFAGQVHPHFAIAAVVGTFPGSITGSALSHRLSTKMLRRVLSLIIAAVGVYLLLEVSGLIPGLVRP